MKYADVLWVTLRWLHAVAAVGWVGSAIFYASVVGPVFRKRAAEKREAVGEPDDLPEESVVGEWREFLEIAAFVLVTSGALLAVNRLTQPRIGASYVIVLGAKVVLAVVMVIVAFRVVNIRNRGDSLHGLVSSSWLMSGLGVVVILLAIVLRMLFERTLVS